MTDMTARQAWVAAAKAHMEMLTDHEQDAQDRLEEAEKELTLARRDRKQQRANARAAWRGYVAKGMTVGIEIDPLTFADGSGDGGATGGGDDGDA